MNTYSRAGILFINHLSFSRSAVFYRIILLLVISFLPYYAIGIPPVKFDHNQDFKFNPNARAASEITENELLQLLSEGNGKLRVFTEYGFSATLNVSFNLLPTSRVQIFLTVDQANLRGDIKYRDFSLEKHLLPPYLDLELQLMQNNSRIIKDIKISNFAWYAKANDSNHVTTIEIPSHRQQNNYTLVVKGSRFHYGVHYLQRVGQLRQAFADYYAADSSISNAVSLLRDLDPADFQKAILDEFRLCEAELMAGRINNQAFLYLLPLNIYDPLDIQTRLQDLNSSVEKVRNDFNSTLSHIDSLYFHSGLALLNAGNRSGATDHLERSLVYNPLYIPAHISLGRLEVERGDPLKAMNRFEPLLGAVPVPENWQKPALGFINELFESELERAQEAMNDGRFLDALKILSSVEAFCNNTLQWDCPPVLFVKIKDVHYGMYRSYLSVANRAMASANYSFAVIYAESALEYASSNAQYITDLSETESLLQKVVDGYFNLAVDAYARNNFALAGGHLDAAKLLCGRYTYLRCRQDAERLAQQASQAQRAAERITVPLVVSEPQVQIPAMTSAQAAEYVRDLLSKGHLSAWAGETGKARDYLNEIIPIAFRFDLRRDIVLNDRIISLTELIRTRECENKQQDIQALINTLQDRFFRGYYIESFNSLQMAQQIHEQSENCNWDFTGMLSSFSYLESAAHYQHLMHDAQSAYFRSGQRGFEIFVDRYNKATGYYNHAGLQEFGVQHESLFEFTVKSSNSSLMQHMVRDFSDSGNPENAIRLLILLKEQGFAARELRQLQEHAGLKAAEHLPRLFPDIRPEKWLEEKTGRDEWFRNYERSFTRTRGR